MSEDIKCISGVTPQAILSKQQYGSGISQSMFSTFDKSKDRKCLVPPTPLKGVTIARLWDAIFSNKSDFLKRYHDKRSETYLDVGKWVYASDMGSGYRTVSLITPVEMPTGKVQTQLNEAHRFAYTMPSGSAVMLLYQISSQTPNVSGGQTFRTEAFLEITANSVDEDCKIGIWGSCKKMSMAFTAIQMMAVPRAIREMTAGYKLMLVMVSEDLTGSTMNVAADGDANRNSDGERTDSPYENGEEGTGAASGRGNGGGGEPQGIAFQGIMLLLAVVVTISILSSVSTLRGATWMVTVMSEQLFDGDGQGWSSSHNSLSSNFNTRQSSGGRAAARSPLTQDQALRHAARDAQIQSLRYRWIEQRVAVSNLESTVGRLWWMNTLQFLFMVLMMVKMIFF